MDLLGEDIKANGLLRGPNYPKSLYGVRVQLFLIVHGVRVATINFNIPLSWLRLLHRWDQRVHKLHRLPHHEECKPISMNFLKR